MRPSGCPSVGYALTEIVRWLWSKWSFHLRLTFQKIHEKVVVFVADKNERKQVFDAKEGDREENHRREQPHELDQTLGKTIS